MKLPQAGQKVRSRLRFNQTKLSYLKYANENPDSGGWLDNTVFTIIKVDKLKLYIILEPEGGNAKFKFSLGEYGPNFVPLNS